MREIETQHRHRKDKTLVDMTLDERQAYFDSCWQNLVQKGLATEPRPPYPPCILNNACPAATSQRDKRRMIGGLIPQEEYEAALRYAYSHGVSMTHVVEMAIDCLCTADDGSTLAREAKRHPGREGKHNVGGNVRQAYYYMAQTYAKENGISVTLTLEIALKRLIRGK